MPETVEAWLLQNEIRRWIETIIDCKYKSLGGLEHNPLEENVLNIHKALREEPLILRRDHFHPSGFGHFPPSFIDPLLLWFENGRHVFLSCDKSMCHREGRSLGKQLKDKRCRSVTLCQAVWSDRLVKGRVYAYKQVALNLPNASAI